ncbi:MAG: tetratricopeptide repeat protein [Chthoniobacterales bacterium]
MKNGRRSATPESAPQSKSSRLGWIVVGLFLAVAIAIRIAVFLEVKSLPDVTSDGLFYQEVAQKIAAGTYWKDASVFTFSPLYVCYLAAVRMLAGADINAVRLTQLAIGIGSIVLIFLIARRLLNRRAAFIALGIAALYVPFVFFEVQILGITLVLGLMLLALFLLVTAVARGSLILLALAGWTLGIAALGAPNLILMAAPFALWLLFFAARTPDAPISGFRGWKPARMDILRAALFSATVLIGILPATLWNYHASGHIIPISTQGGINFYIGNNPQATGYFTAPPGMQDSLVGINIADSKKVAEADAGHPLDINQVSSHWFGKGLHFLLSNPAAGARLMARKTFLYLNRYETPLDVDFDSFKTYSTALRLPLVGFGIVAILSLGGLVLACCGFGRHALLVLSFATYSAAVVAFYVSDRYRLPVVPFLILFSALAIDWALQKWRAGQRVRVVLGAAALIPVSFFVYQPVGYQASPATLCFNLAMSYMKQNDLPRAKAELEKCVAADPGWAEARYDLAAVNHTLGDSESAWAQVVVLERVRNANVLSLRGQLLAEAGLLVSAAQSYRDALAVAPNHAGAQQKLAAVEKQLAAETPQAKAERSRRIQDDIGRRQEADQHERAIADLVEIRDGHFGGMDPAFIETAIGFEYTQLGQLDDAERSFESALQMSPGNALICKNLAILEVKRRDRVKAERYFRQFSLLAPNDPQVATVREMLEKMR